MSDKNPTKCAIYARYSSLSQRDQSIEDQVRACRAHAAREGLEVCEIYADRHISGTTDRRPEFQRMVADSGDAEWSQVLVYKLDRFARSRADAAVYRRALREGGVRLVSVMESIPEGPEGMILEGVMDAMAEYYSANLGQNVVRGMTSNAERCLTNGVRVLGYRKGADGRFEVDEDEAVIVSEMFQRRLGGEPYDSLADWLTAMGVRTRDGTPCTRNFVRDRLRDRKYLGEYRWGKVVVPNGMPRIIDDTTFEGVTAMGRTRRTTTDFTLTGILFDSSGAGYWGASSIGRGGRRYRYYLCSVDGEIQRVRADVVEGAVEEALAIAMSSHGVAEELARQVHEYAERRADEGEIHELEAKAEDVRCQQARLVDSIAKGVDPALLAGKLDELSRMLAVCEDEIHDRRQAIPDEALLAEFIRDALSRWLGMEGRLHEFVKRIELNLHGGTVTVELLTPNMTQIAPLNTEVNRENAGQTPEMVRDMKSWLGH